ncbi:MAG: hypothetical protein R3F40_17650 [Candidatus Competibacteraceae bacterium]
MTPSGSDRPRGRIPSTEVVSGATGGTDMLKALAGPFPDVIFCPTGGITAETAPELSGAAQRRLRRRVADAPKPRWRRRIGAITALARQAAALDRRKVTGFTDSSPVAGA